MEKILSICSPLNKCHGENLIISSPLTIYHGKNLIKLLLPWLQQNPFACISYGSKHWSDLCQVSLSVISSLSAAHFLPRMLAWQHWWADWKWWCLGWLLPFSSGLKYHPLHPAVQAGFPSRTSLPAQQHWKCRSLVREHLELLQENCEQSGRKAGVGCHTAGRNPCYRWLPVLCFLHQCDWHHLDPIRSPHQRAGLFLRKLCCQKLLFAQTLRVHAQVLSEAIRGHPHHDLISTMLSHPHLLMLCHTASRWRHLQSAAIEETWCLQRRSPWCSESASCTAASLAGPPSYASVATPVRSIVCEMKSYRLEQQQCEQEHTCGTETERDRQTET